VQASLDAVSHGGAGRSPHPEGRSAEELGREARSAVSSTAMTGRRTGSGGQRDQRAAGFNHHAATEDDGTPVGTAKKPADLPRSSSRRGLTRGQSQDRRQQRALIKSLMARARAGSAERCHGGPLFPLGRVSVLALSMGDFRALG
jgi:hypothetical protein